MCRMCTFCDIGRQTEPARPPPSLTGGFTAIKKVKKESRHVWMKGEREETGNRRIHQGGALRFWSAASHCSPRIHSTRPRLHCRNHKTSSSTLIHLFLSASFLFPTPTRPPSFKLWRSLVSNPNVPEQHFQPRRTIHLGALNPDMTCISKAG